MRVALKPGSVPVNVEGFPDEVKRSCKGALHLMANTFREITPEELAFIKERRPALHARLLVESEEAVKKPVEEKQTTQPQASGQPQAQPPQPPPDQPVERQRSPKPPQGSSQG